MADDTNYAQQHPDRDGLGTADIFAADDIGGVKTPRRKISVGEDGVANDASQSVPLPTEGTWQVAILKELRIMNFHLSILSDETIRHEDIE